MGHPAFVANLAEGSLQLLRAIASQNDGEDRVLE
jgi:hypothetical protein